MSSRHEILGRRNRQITDEDAQEITRVEELAYDLKISDVMTEEVQVTSPDMAMRDLLDLLRKYQISGAPVIQDGEMVGLISLEDLIRCMTEHNLYALVSDYMTRNVITANADDPVVEAIKVFTKYRIGRLPVVTRDGSLVGMITKGDITRGVLLALERDYKAEEVRRYRASHLFEDIKSDRTSLILRYNIKAQDFLHGGNASSNIKYALQRLGASPQIARRCGIAIYEAEMNLIIHTTHGGVIRVEVEPQQISMQTIDEGPGIADVNQAMEPGFSTASDEIRDLGFGAGMGLVNIKRCVDEMTLESQTGKGTRLKMKIFLEKQESLRETSSAEEDA